MSERIARKPDSAVAHLTAESFAAMCSEAADTPGGFGDLRQRFRTLDLFVLDDLHALERSPLALTELQFTLDALDEAGASVAASARTGPARWTGWPPRLISRLVGGLSVKVDPPGPGLRRRYVLDRSRAKSLRLSASAVEELAERGEDYRSLDGLIARMAMTAKVQTRLLDGSLAGDILDENAAESPHALQSAEVIARTVAQRFGLNLRDLRSGSRRQTLVQPRHLAILLVRRGTDLSFAAIGKFFGKRDAATIRHACKAAEERIARDPALAAEVATIEKGASFRS